MVKKQIVLLHGWGASVSKLTLLKKNLEKLGWKVLLPRLPGFEASDPPKVWDLADYARYVQNLGDKHFKGKYFLFGHSFGGRVSIKASVAFPNKVLGLVLCSTGGLSRGNIFKRVLFYALAKIGVVLMVVPKLAKIFRRILYKLAREGDYYKTTGVMKDTFKNVISEDLKNIVKHIKVKTLVLWGKNDRVTPIGDANYLLRNIKKVSCVFFDNQGHRLPYEKPKEVAGEINKWYTSQI